MKRKKYRVAIIGYKAMGRSHTYAYDKINKDTSSAYSIEKAIICGRNEKQLESASKELGWSEWCVNWQDVINRDDIDIIDICTPPGMHYDIALNAIQKGKHVICEKPLTCNSTKTKHLLDKANKKSVVNCICFNYRYNLVVRFIKDLINNDKLGQVYHIRTKFLMDWANKTDTLNWRYDKTQVLCGVISELGSHLIDLSEFLIGDLKLEGAIGNTFVNKRINNLTGLYEKIDLPDSCAFFGKINNSVLASYDVSFVEGGYGRGGMSCEIHGSKGALRFNKGELEYIDMYNVNAEGTDKYKRVRISDMYQDKFPTNSSDTFYVMQNEFMKAIHTGEGDIPTFYDAYKCDIIMEEVMKYLEKQNC